MSSKAYIEASKKETDKCRIAITNLYMAGINHDGHSWNTFGDIEDCLAVVIEEMYLQGAKEFAEWLYRRKCFDGWYKFDENEEVKLTTDEILAEWQKGAENETDRMLWM